MRSLLISLLVSLAVAISAQAQSIKVLVQSSPLAGFQYHAAGELWAQLRVGDALILKREADNTHDHNAVRVEWQGHMLGYLPRAENRAVAAAMDAGTPVAGRIARLREHPDPWQRILIDVFVVI